MKSKTKLVLFSLLVLFVASCRKGDDDPAFSFRTRKNRVVGDWKMRSGKSTYEEFNSSGSIPYSETYVYTETKYDYTETTGIISQQYSGGHTYYLKFNRNGTILFTEIFDGQASTYKGKWDFNKGIGEAKAKELINVRYESLESSNGTKTYKGDQTNITYTIQELRNRKMVISWEYTIKNEDGSGYSYKESYELTQ